MDFYTTPTALTGQATARDQSRELLGQVMGFVAVTVGFSALGAYIGRDLSGGLGLLFFVGGGFTIVDFNRLRRTTDDSTGGAVAIAAGIFLDIFNVFLLFLDLFGGGDE